LKKYDGVTDLRKDTLDSILFLLLVRPAPKGDLLG